MKILFATLLILSLATETLAAATLIGGPGGITSASTMDGGMWSMHYGFAALAIASASLWVWFSRHNLAAVTPVLGILMVFHTGLFLSLSVAGDQQAGMVIHAVLAFISILLFIRRRHWCTALTPQ